MEFVKKQCKYTFSDEERRENAEKLALFVSEKEIIEDEKKEEMSSFKNRIDEKNMQIRIYANRIRNGYDFRQMECREEKDFDAGVIRYIRTDNGEVVEEKKKYQDFVEEHGDFEKASKEWEKYKKEKGIK